MKKNKALQQMTEVDYIKKLNKREKEYLRKFEEEMYGGNSGTGDDPLMTTAEQIRSDNRTHNNLYRDAFCVALNTNSLNYESNTADDDIMNGARDEIEWEDVFKLLGPAKAVDLIINQAIRDIDENRDVKQVLIRTISKYERLKGFIRRDKRSKNWK